MELKNAKRGIIIAQSVYTHAAGVGSKEKNIELISRDFPSFYLFDHILVPKHEILKEKDKEDLLKKYKIKPYQLPKIKSSDPAARAIGARPGDVIKITRDSPTAGRYVSYRYVIEG
ncbi:DNA-directed RNA polymerase subunit H [Candidatus Bathyarchaeota archaeon]|nr:DNA-directed RNA polymerase subunit H [Candidatus Bathyarchaeota archaeon]